MLDPVDPKGGAGVYGGDAYRTVNYVLTTRYFPLDARGTLAAKQHFCCGALGNLPVLLVIG